MKKSKLDFLATDFQLSNFNRWQGADKGRRQEMRWEEVEHECFFSSPALNSFSSEADLICLAEF